MMPNANWVRSLFCWSLCLLGTMLAAESGPRAALLHIDEAIDPLQSRYVDRAIAEAEAAGCSILITEISSFGGLVVSGHEISQALLKAQDRGMRTIAYVDGHAISAGAMIAFSHQELYLTDNTTIGDIGVIFKNAEGQMEMAPEKYESFVREYLGAVAEKNGWNSAILRKMTAISQDLYEIRHEPDNPDSYAYVLSSRLDAYLADHPDIDREDPQQVLVRWPEGELITLSAKDAMRFGMCTDLIDNLDAVLEQLELTRTDLLPLKKTVTEQIATTLAGWAPLLAAAAVLFIIFEIKTAGVGLFAILGACCGVLFFICQFYLDLAGHLEVVLMLTGLVLIGIELFTMVTGGILGALGGGLLLGGLILAFMPNADQFEVGSEGWTGLLLAALQQASLAVIIGIAGLVAIIARLPYSSFARRLAVAGAITGTSEKTSDPDATDADATEQIATCSSDLHPGGQIRLGDRIESASLNGGGYLKAGTRVRIVGQRFGEKLVEPLPEDTP